MNTSTMPLIAPQTIWEYSPESYRNYIKGLKATYQAEQEAKRVIRAEKSRKTPTTPVPGVTFRINPKGTPIISIRGRKPKYLAPNEINAMASHYGIRQNEFWLIVRAKNIPVRTPDIQINLEQVL